MRIPLWAATTLALLACGGGGRPPAATTRALPPKRPPSTPATTGPQSLVLRVSRTGGIGRVYDYERLDSAIWTSADRVPSVARVLAFDEDGGAVALVDALGAPRRVELRTGAVTGPPGVKLTALHSENGAAVYGVSATGVVTRLTPTDVRPWTFRPPLAARDVAPQTDGSIVIVGEGPDATTLWRVRPPATTLLDTAVLPRTQRLMRTSVGDRAYFASDSSLQPVRTRDLKPAPAVRFPRRLRAIAATPSGDRLYVALDSVSALRVIDRYSSDTKGTVMLPGPASDLRMDSLGRYLLARPAHSPDSAWIVAVGTDRVIGHIQTAWTADLPYVGADGSIVAAQGHDVALIDPQTLAVRRTVTGGARDFWIPIRWNGFRPRAPGLDQPVTFPTSPADTGDSILAAIHRSQRDTTVHPQLTGGTSLTPPVVDSAQGRVGSAAAPAHSAGFTVQLAALLDPDSAKARASRVVAEGQHAHVVAAPRGGATVYLVILGPYPTREAAEAAGRASKQPNPWVYEGAP